VDDIKRHPWFNNLDFEQYNLKRVTAPWIPKIKSPTGIIYICIYICMNALRTDYPHPKIKSPTGIILMYMYTYL
jgi:hypothetical protein